MKTSLLQHILTLYQEGKLTKEVASSLLEKVKTAPEVSPQTTSSSENSGKIAVIGLGCRTAIGNTGKEFFEGLAQVKSGIKTFPENRKQDTDPFLDYYPQSAYAEGDKYQSGGFLESIDTFDHSFFKILPSEATIMDPQQRVFLEMAHEAFESAGYTPASLKGSNTGVFLGDCVNEYRKVTPEINPRTVVGNIAPFITSRVSWFYDLHGPTLNVSTTCSSSLVALHSACQSLLLGECDMALTGAINLWMFPYNLKEDPVSVLGIVSPDGICRTFDEQANGIVRGEGGAAILLKPYDQAVRDGDPILSVILASDVNNDGRSTSVGAPNPVIQSQLMVSTWKKSGVNPRTLQYIECHGTGTKIGDPIEIQALSNAMAQFTKEKQFCGIGSVKTNLGHLTGGASGIVGFAKTVLSLHYRVIPGINNFETPNTLIDFKNSPFYVADKTTQWNREDTPRRAGISAFGFNGTNCHVVIEEHETSFSTEQETTASLILLSARSEGSLRLLVLKHLEYLHSPESERVPLSYISSTLFHKREHYPVRFAAICHTRSELKEQLQQWLNQSYRLIGTESDPLYNVAKEYMEGAANFQNRAPVQKLETVPLPTTPFEKKRFWITDQQDQTGFRTELFQKENAVEAKDSSLSNTQPINVEEKLREVWQKLLGTEAINPQDSFIDLGGDSLLMVQLVGEVRQLVSEEVELSDFMDNDTFEAMANLLKRFEVVETEPIKTESFRDSWPLTLSQKRVWLSGQEDAGNTIYNMMEIFELEGTIDHRRMEKAMNQLIDRHQSLRTVFQPGQDEPVQKVLGDRPSFELPLFNLIDQEQKDSIIDKTIKNDRETPFNLAEPYLLRCKLFQVEEQKYLFSLVIHHIISDGWSVYIMLKELLQIYEALLRDEQPDLAPVGLQLGEYSLSEKEFFNSPRFKQQEKFWMNQLKDLNPNVTITAQKERPALFTHQGREMLFELTPEVSRSVKELAKTHRTSTYSVILAAFYALVFRYSNEQDITIATACSGRTDSRALSLVGALVNLLPLRLRWTETPTFESLLIQVKQLLHESLANQDYPFDLTVEKLNLKRNAAQKNLFNISVTQQDFKGLGGRSLQTESLVAHHVDRLPYENAKWDLEFEVFETEEQQIKFRLIYYQEIYTAEWIEELVTVYQNLVADLIKQSTDTIDTVRLIDQSSIPVQPWKPITTEAMAKLEKEGSRTETIRKVLENQYSEPPIASSMIQDSVVILDKSGNELPCGAVGDLWVKQTTGEREAEKEITIYPLGLSGKRLHDRQIELITKQNQAPITIQGFSIDRIALETQLNNELQPQALSVIDLDNTEGETELWAFFIGAEALSTEKIRKKLLESMPEYMIPKYWISIHQEETEKSEKDKTPEQTEMPIAAPRLPSIRGIRRNN